MLPKPHARTTGDRRIYQSHLYPQPTNAFAAPGAQRRSLPEASALWHQLLRGGRHPAHLTVVTTTTTVATVVAAAAPAAALNQPATLLPKSAQQLA